jgi:Fur family ferric uptake transcriptional regulator
MNETVRRVLDRIHAGGGRLTIPTTHVVTILSSTHDHLTAEDIIAELEQVNPGVAPSTVYRVLQRLHDLGALEHVRGANGAAFYHLREHGHAHLVCSSCGSVIDLDLADGADGDDALHRMVALVRERTGFVLDAHQTAFAGRCSACATSSHHLVSVIDRPPSDEQSLVHRTTGPGEPSLLYDHGGS